jgi:hypothetical protein
MIGIRLLPQRYGQPVTGAGRDAGAWADPSYPNCSKPTKGLEPLAGGHLGRTANEELS